MKNNWSESRTGRSAIWPGLHYVCKYYREQSVMTQVDATVIVAFSNDRKLMKILFQLQLQRRMHNYSWYEWYVDIWFCSMSPMASWAINKSSSRRLCPLSQVPIEIAEVLRVPRWICIHRKSANVRHYMRVDVAAKAIHSHSLLSFWYRKSTHCFQLNPGGKKLNFLYFFTDFAWTPNLLLLQPFAMSAER